MKIIVLKKIVKGFTLGFLGGLVILPILIGIFMLYPPYIFGVDSVVFGDSFFDIVEAGYIITKDDVAELRNLESALASLGHVGLMLGLFAGGVTGTNAYLRHRKVDSIL